MRVTTQSRIAETHVAISDPGPSKITLSNGDVLTPTHATVRLHWSEEGSAWLLQSVVVLGQYPDDDDNVYSGRTFYAGEELPDVAASAVAVARRWGADPT